MDLVFCLPRYTPASNGIHAQHRIAMDAAARGHRVRVQIIERGGALAPGKPGDLMPGCVLPFYDGRKTVETIAWQSEVTPGYAIGVPRVVRYVGNREGYLTGQGMGARADDFVLAHSRAVHPNPGAVLFFADYPPHFNRRGAAPVLARTLDACYPGKGELYGATPTPEGVLTVGRDWPRTQPELATMLRSVRFFYSWDAWTQTNVDAIACGCILVILGYGPWSPADIDGSELGKIPRLDGEHQQIDLDAYEADREALFARRDALIASWPERVDSALAAIEHHFAR
jgi:hypothetical protein